MGAGMLTPLLLVLRVVCTRVCSQDPYAARPAALLLLPLGPVAHSVVQYPGSEVKASNHR